MKASAVCVFFCLVFTASAAGPQRKIAFQRGHNIWIANIDGTGVKRIAVGSQPSISSAGTKITFVTAPPSAYHSQARGAQDNPESHIAIADLASGKVTILRDIPSDSSFGPVFSPDGKLIVFSSRREFFRDLNVIKEDGTGSRVIVRGTEIGHPMYYSPCWAPDGRSIFCHNARTICQLGLDGAILAQWDIGKIAPDGMTGSISVSPDGNRLLVSNEYRKNSEAPPPSLWSFDLATQQSTRLVTPKELSVSEGCWLDKDNILFQSGAAEESDEPVPSPAIYRMSLDGKNLKLLIKNGLNPTVSTP